MSFSDFILTPVRTIVCHLLKIYLERKKRLDQTNFDPQFFKAILFFTQLFTTFNLSFRRGSDEFPLNQQVKY